MIKKLFFLIIIASANLYSQDTLAQKKGIELIDSLERKLPELNDDTIKVRVLYQLSVNLYATNPDKGIDYGNKTLALSEKIKYTTGLAIGNGALGINYSLGKNDNEKALQYFLKALECNTVTKNKKGIASVCANIANTYTMQGIYSKALEYYLIALQNHQEAGNKSGVATTFTNMANIYEDLGEYDKAIKHHQDAVKIFKELNNTMYIAIVYSNLGNIYKKIYDSVTAKKYLQEALSLYQQINHKLGISTVYTSLAELENDNEKAIQLYNTAYDIRKELGSNKNLHFIHSGLASAYYNLANTAKNMGDRQNYLLKAKTYVDSALATENITKELAMMSHDYLLSSKIDSAMGNYKGAFENIFNYKIFSDSVTNLNHFKKITETQLEFDFEKKKAALETEQKLSAIATQKEIALKELNYAFEKKQALAKTEKEKEKIRYEHQLQEAKIQNEYAIKKANLENEHNNKMQLLKQAELERQQQFAIIKLKEEEKSNKEKYTRNILLTIFSISSIAGIIAFLQYRKQQSTKRKLELEQTKTRISKDLHDDVGSTLTTISMHTEVIKKRIKNSEDFNDLVFNIDKSSKEMISKMGDIVWSLNLENENLKQLFARLENYCALSLPPSNIQYSLPEHSELFNMNMAPGILKEIYLIAKEAINNAAKYAQCTNIDLQMYQKQNNLVFQIKDNGIGIDNMNDKPLLGGKGIQNMRDRAKKIKSTLEIISAKDKGTAIILTIPL